jgi:hypothetical protein
MPVVHEAQVLAALKEAPSLHTLRLNLWDGDHAAGCDVARPSVLHWFPQDSQLRFYKRFVSVFLCSVTAHQSIGFFT